MVQMERQNLTVDKLSRGIVHLRQEGDVNFLFPYLWSDGETKSNTMENTAERNQTHLFIPLLLRWLKLRQNRRVRYAEWEKHVGMTDQKPE